MTEVARYDGFAEWYDSELATAELGRSSQRVALRLLEEPASAEREYPHLLALRCRR